MAAFKKIAHRGASGRYPENSRLAFEKALEAGVDMIEIDCQLSADGHVVVFHDERLNRTAAARGAVKDKTLAQLRQLDIGGWRKPAFAGQGILTLEEALEIFAGAVDLCLEIKSFGATAPDIELKLLFILSHYNYLDQTVISSFDYKSLSRVRELAPEASLGVLFGSRQKADPLEFARRIQASSLHLQKELVARPLLQQAWDEGLDVYVWTVNETRQMEVFVEMGVQGLISDFPERFAKLGPR